MPGRNPWWKLAVPCAFAGVMATLVLSACGQGGEKKSYEDRMAAEHAGETPTPSPATEGEPAVPLTSSEVVYASLDGRDVKGYLARPADATGPLPGILVIHEWWGLNDNIRAMADKLAGEGYVALAVDLYGGRAATDSDGARELATEVSQNPDAAKENLRQAHAYLKNEAGATKIGTVGWCFGGGWSLQTALLLPGQVDATVIYYGRLVTDPDQLAVLETPILGLFGELDRGISVDDVHAFEAALRDLGKDVSVTIYPGANHAFANPSGERYDAAAATDAWDKTLAFFAEHLAA